MSKMKGLCPKFASTTSPGVCRPTVGYRLGLKKYMENNRAHIMMCFG